MFNHQLSLFSLDVMWAGEGGKAQKVEQKDEKGRRDHVGNKTRNITGNKWANLLMLSPKLETLSLWSEGKLSMDAVSQTVSEMVGRPSSGPASVLLWVSWRNTYTSAKKTLAAVFINEPISVIYGMWLCIHVNGICNQCKLMSRSTFAAPVFLNKYHWNVPEQLRQFVFVRGWSNLPPRGWCQRCRNPPAARRLGWSPARSGGNDMRRR